MARRNINNKVNHAQYGRRQSQFNAMATEIEADILVYNKLSDENKIKWLAKDPLLSAFISLAAKVKR